MKQRTHSGAKKRLKPTGSGKVKRRKAGLRHLMECKSSKRKRQLCEMTYVHSANAYQTERLLCL